MNSEHTKAVKCNSYAGSVVLYAFVVGIAIVAPLFLHALNVPLIDWWSQIGTTFQWFGFTATCALLLIAAIELKGRKGKGARAWLPIVLWVLVSLHFLSIMTYYHSKSGDYQIYERSARHVVEGKSPYDLDTYQYPPLKAPVMAGLYTAISRFATRVGIDNDAHNPWGAIFYLYECIQLLLIIFAYWLLYLFARMIGIGPIASAVISTIVLVFNNPLFGMVVWNQVNLWLLDTALVACLLVQSRPFIGGLAIALGGLIKFYPLILLVPWTLVRQWRVLIGAVVGIVGILLWQTSGGQNWDLWREFWRNFTSYPTYRLSFANVSIHNLVYYMLEPVRLLTKLAPDSYQSIVATVTGLITVALIIWFGLRFAQREKAHRRLCGDREIASDGLSPSTLRLIGHAMDALALLLLVSPCVWTHHYVMATPIVLWTIAMRGPTRPWHVGIAVFLTLALQPFTILFVNYHRVVGLLMMIVLTAPDKVALHLEEGETEPGEGTIAQLLRT